MTPGQIEFFMLAPIIAFGAGLFIGVTVMMRLYNPWIKELKGYIDYWYESWRNK